MISKAPFTLIIQGLCLATGLAPSRRQNVHAGCRVSLGLTPPPARDKSIRSTIHATKNPVACQIFLRIFCINT